MINKLVKFPLFESDSTSFIKLNELQKKSIIIFKSKIEKGEYRYILNNCLCGNLDEYLDTVLSEKDRYGIENDIVLCGKCGLVRSNKILDEKSTAEFYKNEYRDIYVGEKVASHDFFYSQIRRGDILCKFVSKHIDINKINSVFEVGCGAGGILFPFFKLKKTVSGCDFGEEYLKFGTGKGLDLYQGELNYNKTPKGSVDLVILSHVLEHFNNPVQTLLDIVEIVKPCGYILVEVPGIYNINKTYFNPLLYFQNAHVYYFCHYYLKFIFEYIGLEVVYGDEKCVFVLKKTSNWVRSSGLAMFDDKINSVLPSEIEIFFKRCYLADKLKINIYYYRYLFVKLLGLFGVKWFVKKIVGLK